MYVKDAQRHEKLSSTMAMTVCGPLRSLIRHGPLQVSRKARQTVPPSRQLATVNNGLQVQRLAGVVGAEVRGVSLRDLDGDEAAVNEIRNALLSNGVIFFRDQELSPSEYLEASKKFGKPVLYPMVKGLDDFPEITHVLKQEHEKTNFGGIWHSVEYHVIRWCLRLMLTMTM